MPLSYAFDYIKTLGKIDYRWWTWRKCWIYSGGFGGNATRTLAGNVVETKTQNEIIYVLSRYSNNPMSVLHLEYLSLVPSQILLVRFVYLPWALFRCSTTEILYSVWLKHWWLFALLNSFNCKISWRNSSRLYQDRVRGVCSCVEHAMLNLDPQLWLWWLSLHQPRTISLKWRTNENRETPPEIRPMNCHVTGSISTFKPFAGESREKFDFELKASQDHISY